MKAGPSTDSPVTEIPPDVGEGPRPAAPTDLLGRGITAVTATLGTGGWALLGALAAAGVSNLVFHLAMGRLLAPTDYGVLGALIALLTVALVPATAAQLSITRAVASRTQTHWDLGLLTRRLTLAALTLAGATAIVAPWLRTYLHLESTLSLILIALVLVPTAPLVAVRGLALGQLRYRVVAAATLAGTAMKLAVGMALVTAGLGVDGAIVAIVAGEATMVMVLWRAVRADSPGGSPTLRIRFGETASAVSAHAGFWMLAGVGVVLARHYQPESAGHYAAGWLIAGLALFLPAAVATVAFPRFAQGSEAQGRAVLKNAMIWTLVLAAAAGSVSWLVPSAVMELAMGDAYRDSGRVLPILAMTSVLIALVNTLVHYHLARRSSRAHLPWLGVVGVAVASLANHQSIETIAWLSVAGAALVLLSLAVPGTDAPARLPRRLTPNPRQTPPPKPADLDLTVVVPYYNPGPAVLTTLRDLETMLGACGHTYEIIPVSDGCTDGSDDTVEAMASPTIRPVRLPCNNGKGEALRVGLAQGRGRYLGFMDADGDIDPTLWRPFIALADLYQPDIVLGSKRHPMSEVDYPPLRRLYSICYQILVRGLFRLKIRDTQTGIKLIRRQVLTDILPYTLERRFTLDLELLVVAGRFGHRRFFEAPVRIKHQFRSTISLRSVVQMLIDTVAVFHRLHIGHWYDPPHRAVTKSRERLGTPIAAAAD